MTRVVIVGAGVGGLGAGVRLAAAGCEVLVLEASAQVGGKLAQVGARLVAGTVKKMADEFFGTFTAIVGGEAQAQSQAQSAPVGAAPAAVPAAAAAKKSWASPLTIGILVIAAILVIYFVVT